MLRKYSLQLKELTSTTSLSFSGGVKQLSFPDLTIQLINFHTVYLYKVWNKYTVILYTSTLLVLDNFTKQSETLWSVAEQRFTLLCHFSSPPTRLPSYGFVCKISSFFL